MFDAPVVFTCNALNPTATLFDAVVFAYRACLPTAVL